jgi:hypothetical protein
MTKLNAYRCDRCQGWIEEKDNTDALIVLNGKTVGRFRRDLCPPCIEKLELGEPDEVPTPAAQVLPSTRRQRQHTTPEEKVALVRRGKQLLDNGMTRKAVAESLGIGLSTWNAWYRTVVSASLSASGADPDRTTRASLGV